MVSAPVHYADDKRVLGSAREMVEAVTRSGSAVASRGGRHARTQSTRQLGQKKRYPLLK